MAEPIETCSCCSDPANAVRSADGKCPSTVRIMTRSTHGIPVAVASVQRKVSMCKASREIIEVYDDNDRLVYSTTQ